MSIDKDGLAAAHEAYAKTVGGTMEGHPMANAITAYLAALPNTGDELVSRLRSEAVAFEDAEENADAFRCEENVSHAALLRQASDAIALYGLRESEREQSAKAQREIARLAAAEAQLKAAREALTHAQEAIDDIHEDHFGHGHVSDSRGQVTSYPFKLALMAEIRDVLSLIPGKG